MGNQKISSFIQKWDFHDCRERERDRLRKEFTWKREKPFVARHLEYLLYRTCLMPGVSITEIVHFPTTDHRAVRTEFLEYDFPKGPPRCHFNTSYLKIMNLQNILTIEAPKGKIGNVHICKFWLLTLSPRGYDEV